MSDFCFTQPLSGIWHIRDAMGVHMTLVCGHARALLIDAGYGVHDVRAALARVSALPLQLALTHAHHDHVLGAVHFPGAWLHPADSPVWDRYTAPAQRARVLAQAQARGLLTTPAQAQAFLSRPLCAVQPMPDVPFDLGGLHVTPVHIPGHTPGSVCFYIEERSLLLCGDSWNPQTWLFFDECESYERYAQGLRTLLPLRFEHVLCAHDGALHPRSRLERYIDGLTPETRAAAVPVTIAPYAHKHTRACHPEPDTTLLFDADK